LDNSLTMESTSQEVNKSYHLVQTQVNTHLHGEITKEKCFQTTILDDDFGHDWGPIVQIF
jgi:hypothetical protein